MIRAGMRYGAPETTAEAAEAYASEKKAGRSPIYYGGGTEAATLGRRGKIRIDTLIDLKKIPDTMVLERRDACLHVGAGLPLNAVIDSGLFPLFSRVASKIADRTVRNRLSVGGNIAGRLPYREAVMPFLLSNASAVIAGEGGVRQEAFPAWFDRRLLIEPGEFLVKLLVPVPEADLPFYSVRRTGHSAVDYPVLHAAGVRAQGRLRLSVSGLCSFPFRSPEVEDVLNGSGDVKTRVEKALGSLPGPVKDDIRSGREYRMFLFGKALIDVCSNLEAEG